MPNLQMKNVPPGLHQKIRNLAAARGVTVRDLVLDAIRREVAREELRVRLQSRSPVKLGRPAAVSLREARAERDQDLSR